MSIETILWAILIIAAVCVIGFLIYLHMRDKTLEEIRVEVYHLFLVAERAFKETDAGKEKMHFVIQNARLLLPRWLQFFITETMLEKWIQEWFDAIKDLLDDGKLNGTRKEG